MTVIQPNSISGITSITAQGDTINIYKSNGVLAGLQLNGVNISNTSGVSTFSSIVATNINSTGVATFAQSNPTNLNVSGVATFTSSRPVNLSVSGVTTTSSIIVGTAVTINSTGINAPGIGITIANVNGGQLGGSRNIIINGSMVVNQRGWTGAAGTSTDGSYITDRFLMEFSHDGVVSAGQTTLTSGNAYADGFRNASILRVTTADSSLSANQYQLIEQRIEGYNVQGIKKGTANALSVALSFWVRSTTTGTYIAELRDEDNTRTISQAYTINAANTWEKKTLTYPADTTGAFDNDSANSLTVFWWLAAGSTWTSGTLQTTWGTQVNANRAVGQVNALGTVGDFYLTGVQLEVGPTATEFERRSYGQELALCQRYFELTGDIYYRSYNTSSAAFRMFTPFKVSKRTSSPTVTVRTVGGNDFTGGTAGSVQISGSSYGITSIITTAWSYTWETTSSPASTATHDIGWKLVVDNEF